MPHSPVCIEDFLDTEGSAQEVLQNSLAATKELSRRHAELFYTGGTLYPKGREREILTLTNDILDQVKKEQGLYWSVALGLAALKQTEACAQLAADPSLALVPPDERLQESLIERVAGLVASASDTFADRIVGDIKKWPQTLVNYPGNLLDIHYGFWKARKQLARVNTNDGLSAELLESIQKTLSRFPAKTFLVDVHSLAGRPGAKHMGATYQAKIEAFLCSIEAGEPSVESFMVSTTNSIQFTFMALDAAIRDRYSPNEALRIVAENSVALGRLTERVTENIRSINHDMFHFVGSRTHPTLVIDYPEMKYEFDFDQATSDKLQRRDKKGGVCVVRNPVPLQRTSRTYKNTAIFLSALKGRIGASPDLLRSVNGNVYLDVAGLSMSYALLAINDNYKEGR